MRRKVVIGIKDELIVFVDLDTSKKTLRSAVTEGCDAVLITEMTDELRMCWTNELNVRINITKSPDGFDFNDLVPVK